MKIPLNCWVESKAFPVVSSIAEVSQHLCIYFVFFTRFREIKKEESVSAIQDQLKMIPL